MPTYSNPYLPPSYPSLHLSPLLSSSLKLVRFCPETENNDINDYTLQKQHHFPIFQQLYPCVVLHPLFLSPSTPFFSCLFILATFLSTSLNFPFSSRTRKLNFFIFLPACHCLPLFSRLSWFIITNPLKGREGKVVSNSQQWFAAQILLSACTPPNNNNFPLCRTC